VIEVDEANGDVLAIRAERHRLLTRQPGHEFLVGHHGVRHSAGGDEDGPEVVDDLVGLGRIS
jgi:hypothetical protein